MDLLISTNASATRATVQRAEPGQLPRDAFVVRPGESLLDVPYDAWLARVGETVDPRELLPAREPLDWEEAMWTSPLGPRARAVLTISVALVYLAEAIREPGGGLVDVAAVVALCGLAAHVALTTFLDLPLPRWLFRTLLVAFLVLAAVSFVS